jgi:Holliday junction resolvase RusA-like endonuclease
MNQEIIEISSSSSKEEEDPNHAGPFDVWIDGDPKPMPRPNFMAWIRNGKLLRRVVNPAKADIATLRNTFRTILMENYPSIKSLPLYPTGSVKITAIFDRRLPNSAFVGGDRTAGLKANGMKYNPSRPDIDNYAKLLLDAMQGVAYADDCQVVKLVIHKKFDTLPPCEGKTIVRVKRFVS